MKRCLCLWLLLILAVAPGQAFAQDKLKSFDDYFAEAKDAFVSEDYEAAAAALQKAYHVSSDGRVLLNLAVAYERMGECHKAIVYYRAVIQDPEVDASRKGKAKGALDKQLSKCKTFDKNLAGRLILLSTPPLATVYIDGVRSGTTPMEAPALVRGSHEVRIIQGDLPPYRKMIKLEPGKDQRLDADLKEAQAAKPKEPVDGPPSPFKEDPKGQPTSPGTKDESGLNIPAIALLSAGVLTLGVAFYIDAVDIPSIDDERQTLANELSMFSPMSEEYQQREAEFNELTDKRDTRSTIAVASYVTGGLLVSAGAGWLIYDLVNDSPSDAQLGAQLGPDYQGATVRWSF